MTPEMQTQLCFRKTLNERSQGEILFVIQSVKYLRVFHGLGGRPIVSIAGDYDQVRPTASLRGAKEGRNIKNRKKGR